MRLIGMLVAVTMVGACATDVGGPSPAPTESARPAPTASAAAPSDGATVSEIDEQLADMTIEDQIRQLLVIHVYGTAGDAATDDHRAANLRLYGAGTPAEVIRTVRPGGVIYIKRNEQDPQAADLESGNLSSTEQAAQLSADLQAAAGDAGVGVGLLIATDQENGLVTRLPDGQRWPGAAELGADEDRDRAREVATDTGQALADVGVNVNLAPVADVNTNADNPVIGERAFSNDPDVVAGMVTAQVEGYLAAGVAPTLKHFPGHGAASADSHVELPIIDLSRADWDDVHLPPFAAGLAAGAPLVMTAHVAAPALDPSGGPATLSAAVITGLLRDHLGYDGVVMTDSLWMQAVRGTGGDGQVAVAALAAGADLLLMPPDVDAVVAAVTDAVDRGDLAEARLDASVRRILALKAGRVEHADPAG